MVDASCKIEVSEWKTEDETEKYFGSCILSPNAGNTFEGGAIEVDRLNRVIEFNEKNNFLALKIPPNP